MNTRTRAVTALAAVLMAAPALSACGGGGDSSDAGAAVEGYFHAIADKDAEGACKLQTTEDGKKPLESDDTKFQECVKSITMIIGMAKGDDLDQLKDIKVKEATVDGETATVSQDQVEGLPDAEKSDSEKPVKLVKLDGKWYLDGSGMSVSG